MRHFWRRAWVGAAMAVAALGSHAQPAVDKWPAKPITFIVPFTPGGVTDNAARLLGTVLTERLGQSVIVDNRPGAGGSIGVEMGARQPPDGYTMIYGTQGTHGANLALYKNVAYDPIKDFEPVHGLSETSLILVVNPNRPFKTVPELVAYAKANPGKLNVGSAGPGTGTHLTAEMFQMASGTKLTHVPYKGSSPALTDLMAGNLDLMFDYASVVTPHIEAGKLRALAVTAKTRQALTPDLPAMAELGYPGAESSAWSVVFMPAKTPPAIVRKMADAIEAAQDDPRLQAESRKFGNVLLKGLQGEKLRAFVKTESVRWQQIVEKSGAKLN